MPFPADSPELIDEIARIYGQAATRIKNTILHPPGNSDRAKAFNQARAADLGNQVKTIITDLKGKAAGWTGKAITRSITKGQALADKQMAEIFPNSDHIPKALQTPHAFTQIQHDVVRTLARDTVGDLIKSADSMERTAGSLLRRMSATGVTNEQVNQILAGRHVIEGQPAEAVRALRVELEKVHGEQVTIVGPSGQPRTYDCSYYADMVATTKTREAVVKSTNNRLQEHGIDLVRIVGRNSIHFCTNYLYHVYSISGESSKYPALESLPNAGPPFHPNCSKSPSPFIEGLSRTIARGVTAAAA